MQPIHTLEARGNLLLGLLCEHFGLTLSDIRLEIDLAHQAVMDALSQKGVNYQDLRAALVPKPTRTEAGFLFDTLQLEYGYGYEVAEKLLPLLHHNHRCSILEGDLIHPNEGVARDLLEHYCRPVRKVAINHTSQLYCVYINNLSEAMLETIDAGLRASQGYVGYIPLSYSTPMKDWISTTVVPTYVKNGGTFIGTHPDDHSELTSMNSPGWPLSDHNYGIVSVSDTYFGLFLSYKIERATYPGFESDNLYALAAISAEALDLESCDVVVEDAKLQYLRKQKSGSLEAAGLMAHSSSELACLIKSKISQNYLYNLRHEPSRDQSSFNIVIEVNTDSDPFRLMASLEYQAGKNEVRVITMY